MAGTRLGHLPGRPAALHRFNCEEAMDRLESETAVTALVDPTTRHLVIVTLETGLRAGDASRLRLDCLEADSVGWPCLRYEHQGGGRAAHPPHHQSCRRLPARRWRRGYRWPRSVSDKRADGGDGILVQLGLSLRAPRPVRDLMRGVDAS